LSPEPVAIHVESLAKSYDGKLALHPISLDVRPGETVALIGPSGSGKSTLLRLLMGLVTADSGVVRYGDRDVEPGSLRELRQRVGYVIQEGGLFPHLTAADNVALKARDLRWDEARIRARVDDLASLVHLPRELLGRFPAQLSGGQRQRVGLMRALMLDPEALLLDEPLGALDPMIRSRLQTDLREIFRTLGKTVVLVTHDLGEAAFLGDRIVLMRDGRVAQIGTFADLRDRPADPFVTEFLRAQRAVPDAEAAPA